MIGWIILWAVIFIVALVIEFVTTELVSIWGCVGAVVALILAIFDVAYYWQIVAFVAATGIALLLCKLLYHPDKKETKTNIDSEIGNEILITKDVSLNHPGEGKIRDVVWTVKVKEDVEIKEGEFAIIDQIKGNSIIVKAKL